MAEQDFVVKTPDGFKLYGLLNTAAKKNDKLVIHVPYLAGTVRDYAAVRMALAFPGKGYDVLRIELYGWEEQARSLTDCTFKIHAQDIDLVFKHVTKRYEKIFATGHSFGGPSLMESRINQFTAVSLWDPTYLPSKTIHKEDYKKSGDLYVLPQGTTHVMGEKFMNAAAAFDRAYAISLAKKCKVPLQVIYGGKDPYWLPEGESFHTHAKGLVDEKVIKTSQHFFHEQGSTNPLLRYTREWFDRF